MSPEVAALVRQVLPATQALKRVLLLSPSPQLRELFPNAQVLAAKDWELSKAKPELRVDLIVAVDVFRRAAAPAVWFENVLGSCRALLCVDAWPPNAFELAELGSRLLARRTLPSPAPAAASQSAALIAGKLGQPLLRIDDYPTGVRPIVEDLGPLHAVLDQFEQRGLDYYLGIVPGITDAAMFQHLRGLKHMIPAQHGYDHKYPKYSALLRRVGDLDNSKGTVGGFNEFAWQFSSSVERALSFGKLRLENELSRKVEVYIPPCNRCNRTTAKVLGKLGFTLCLSEKPAPGHHVPTLGSGFYGRSPQISSDAAGLPEVLSFHATWEADLWRNQEQRALPAALDTIVVHTRQRAEAVTKAASALEQARV